MDAVVGGRGALSAGGRWGLALYPDAWEAGGSFRSALPARRGGGGGGVPDRERALEEAARRARAKVRRYCAANRLNRLGTLTYAGEGCHDPAVVRADAAGFFKRLRVGLGGEPLPYLWVPEWHPGGHGLHLHFAVGRHVGHSLIKAAWGLGIVHIKLLGDLPVGSASLGEARLAARYLGKYASKAVDADRPAGLHRFEIAQGFTPSSLVIEGRSPDDVIGQASERMGRSPSHVWLSGGQDGWQGPPACWVVWDD